MNTSREDFSEFTRAVSRIQANVMAITCAALGGVGFFFLTAWLLVKGGQEVGPHLRLLSQYFIGYSVTWKGSLIGGLYGALVGGVGGWLIATVYNGVVALRARGRR